MKTIEESITQYGHAWNVQGLENIKTALEDCWIQQSTYVDTQNEMVKGIDGLASLINGFHHVAPGHTLRQLSKVDFHHNCGRFKWENIGPNGDKMEGMDYFEYNDDNQITCIVGFFGPFTNL
ncbi:isomerase [Pedobacter psychroterrae]|uniref:Isomerase n=1 Tax=Pedobacter psychroterrae TaxID=2530453 RepID=A0A4R0NT93_9SPHI|nr:isomerase [Pedobacter psychroterrae]TCD03143.1 isomerase [Pedobacter psychroterrae]